jgi:hypothetical protein
VKFLNDTDKLVKTENRAPHEYVEALGAAVFGYQEGSNVMVFFRTYLDVSGAVDDSPLIVMAGYVAPITQWAEFVKKWTAILRREKISIWHMFDFNRRVNEYSGWNEERCERVYLELIQVMTTHVSVGVVVAIDVEAYREMIVGRELTRCFGANPYQCCVYTCIIHVNNWAKENFISQRIAYTLERGDKGQEKILKRTLTKAFDDEGFCEKFQLGALTTVGKKDPEAIPCQAADILAWEFRWELAEQRTTSPRPPRYTLGEVLYPSARTVILDRNTIPLIIASHYEEYPASIITESEKH